jgi:hypothetical protein
MRVVEWKESDGTRAALRHPMRHARFAIFAVLLGLAALADRVERSTP